MTTNESPYDFLHLSSFIPSPLKIESRRSNVEVCRTCQFVITVLTPATT
jgi:hypothetical protein